MQWAPVLRCPSARTRPIPGVDGLFAAGSRRPAQRFLHQGGLNFAIVGRLEPMARPRRARFELRSMTVATSLLPGLDDIVRRGDPKRRGEIARAIAALFFQDAAKLRPDLVDLFDNLLIDLVPHAELASRADLAERFSWLDNAPPRLVGQFARENEIMVAAPVLRRSPVLDDAALVEIARLKGQGHLLAMTERPTLSVQV